MTERIQAEDGFVPADVFFGGNASDESIPGNSLKIDSRMHLSGILSKISSAEGTENMPPHRGSRTAQQENVESKLLGAVLSSSANQSERPGNSNAPSILFATKEAEQRTAPLPKPKPAAPTSVHGRQLTAAFASEATKVIAAVRSTKEPHVPASDIQAPMEGASADLLALKSAVQALKISQAPPSLRMAKLVTEPARELASEAGKSIVPCMEDDSTDGDFIPPTATAVPPTSDIGSPHAEQPKTPGPPANTPASPSLMNGAPRSSSAHSIPVEALKVSQAIESVSMEAGTDGAGREAAAHNTLVTPTMNQPIRDSGICAPSPAMTEYDGEDVVMGDVDVSQPTSVTSVKGGNLLQSGPRSSRFRAEALRLRAVTPTQGRAFQEQSRPVSEMLTTGVSVADHASAEQQETKNEAAGVKNPAGGDTKAPIRQTPRHPAVTQSLDKSMASPAVVRREAHLPGPRRLSDTPIVQNRENAENWNPGLAPFQQSPLGSGVSSGSVSTNPLFDGTPSHSTPLSIMMIRPDGLEFSLRSSSATSTATAGGQGSAASEGIRLAEKLHQAAEKLHTPLLTARDPVDSSSLTAPNDAATAVVCSAEDASFEFKDDVVALLKALDARTPMSAAAANEMGMSSPPDAGGGPATGAAARALAVASTEERPRTQARRRSSLSSCSPTILDLSGFDANGERNAPGAATPLALAGKADAAIEISPPAILSSNLACCSRSDDVSALHQRIAELEEERSEAASLLSGYQGSIAELQDRHSAAIVKMQAKISMLQSESERLRAERADIHSQFESLYRDKYQPLKVEAAVLRRGADALRARITEEETKGSRLTQLEQELAAAHQVAQASQQIASAAQAEAGAAKEAARLAEHRTKEAISAAATAEQQWAAKLETESQRAEQIAIEKEAEIASWREKYASIARQHDDAVHLAHVAQAAKERKCKEVVTKEEEICSLEVRLREVERVLGEYKVENDKFFSVKERYKTLLAGLEREVAVKEEEKSRLAAMCNELMCQAEKEAALKK